MTVVEKHINILVIVFSRNKRKDCGKHFPKQSLLLRHKVLGFIHHNRAQKKLLILNNNSFYAGGSLMLTTRIVSRSCVIGRYLLSS